MQLVHGHLFALSTPSAPARPTGGAQVTTEQYRQVSERFFIQTRAELAAGDLPQGSEKGYATTTEPPTRWVRKTATPPSVSSSTPPARFTKTPARTTWSPSWWPKPRRRRSPAGQSDPPDDPDVASANLNFRVAKSPELRQSVQTRTVVVTSGRQCREHVLFQAHPRD